MREFFIEGGNSLMTAVAEAPFGIFDQINEMALKYAEDRAATLVTDIEDTTRDRLRDLVSSALEDGRDPNQLADDIWSSSGEFSEDRAYTIAITELADAQGQGGLQTAEATGVDMEKKWIRGDDTPCDICDPNADVEWIDIDQEFPSGDDTVSGHPHCLCDVVYRVKETSDGDGNGTTDNSDETDGGDGSA